MSWWSRFLTWLGISEPGRRKEQVEDWIEANAVLIQSIHDEQETTKDSRGGYRQLRRQDRAVASLPSFAEMRVDVYESPVPSERANKTTTFGYTTTFDVTEADGSLWSLTLVPGSDVAPEWEEMQTEAIDVRNPVR